MKLDEADSLIGRLGSSVGLFITDRCPVGCGHCSVNSLPDSPRISDFALFLEIVDAICASPCEVVGITGGEPFIERRALGEAVSRFASAGKRVIVYTSGIWATSPDPPAWVRKVASQLSMAFVSTDAFHEEQITQARFENAVRTFADRGVPVVVQVIDKDDFVEQAHKRLAAALGPDWPARAEIRLIQPIPYGRGKATFADWAPTHGGSFGKCRMAGLPLIRYNGIISVCCNEALIMGRGPEALRRRVTNRAEAEQALAYFVRRPLFRAIRNAGFGVLTRHPDLSDLADREFRGICHLCWELAERVESAGPEAFFEVAAQLGIPDTVRTT